MKQNNVRRLIIVIFSFSLFALVVSLTSFNKIITVYANSNVDQPVNSAVETQTAEFYVNDFADIFSDSQKEELIANAEELHDEFGGIQVVITTLQTLNGTPIRDYAYDMYNQYEIGKDGMGILVLCATEDREVFIATGEQMEIYITDSMAGRIIDKHGLEYFKSNQFDIALINVQEAIINQISSTVPTDWDKKLNNTASSIDENVQNDAEDETISEKGNASEQLPLVAGFIALIISFIVAAKSAIGSHNYKKLYNEQKNQNDNLKKQHMQNLSNAKSNYNDELMHKQESYNKQIVAIKEDYQQTLVDVNSEIANLKQKLNEETLKTSELSTNLSNLEDIYRRVKVLHPDIEDEVAEQLQQELQAEATDLDTKLAEIIVLTADKDRISIFKNALDLLASASPGVSKYLKTDPLKLHQLHEDSVKLLNEFERAEQEKADRKAANVMDNKINAILCKFYKGSYSNYEEIRRVNDEFNMLTTSQKAFVSTIQTSSLAKLLKDAKEDYELYQTAQKAEREVTDIISHISRADEDDRDKLAKAMNIYKRLSSSEQQYFDSSLLSKLKNLIRQADDDHRDQERRRKQKKEEEDRRRRQSSSHSSYSHSGSSYHSGYSGSRTSGGGAGRKF